MFIEFIIKIIVLALVNYYSLFVCYCVYNKVPKQIGPSGINKVVCIVLEKISQHSKVYYKTCFVVRFCCCCCVGLGS